MIVWGAALLGWYTNSWRLPWDLTECGTLEPPHLTKAVKTPAPTSATDTIWKLNKTF